MTHDKVQEMMMRQLSLTLMMMSTVFLLLNIKNDINFQIPAQKLHDAIICLCNYRTLVVAFQGCFVNARIYNVPTGRELHGD